MAKVWIVMCLPLRDRDAPTLERIDIGSSKSRGVYCCRLINPYLLVHSVIEEAACSSRSFLFSTHHLLEDNARQTHLTHTVCYHWLPNTTELGFLLNLCFGQATLNVTGNYSTLVSSGAWFICAHETLLMLDSSLGWLNLQLVVVWSNVERCIHVQYFQQPAS